MPTLENEALQGRLHGIRVAPGPTRVAFACALRDVLPAVATGLPGLGGSSALPSRPRVCRQDRMPTASARLECQQIQALPRKRGMGDEVPLLHCQPIGLC